MKRFFYIFLCFLCVFGIPFSSFAEKKEENDVNYSIERTVDYFDSFKESLSSEKDSSKIQKTPFGSIQLFSASTGTLGMKKLMFALNVDIFKAGQLYHPLLNFKSVQNVKENFAFYPIETPLSPKEGIYYTRNVALPFVIEIQDENQPVSFDLNFHAKWCQQDICQDIHYVVPFHIDSGYNYFSKYSAFVMEAFRVLPETTHNIDIYSYTEDSFWISFNMDEDLKNPVFMLLNNQNQPMPYTIVSEQINGKQAVFVIQTENLKEIKNVVIETNGNVYSLKMNMQQKNPPQLNELVQKKRSYPVYLWILFFIFSPTLVLLFSSDYRNEITAPITLKKQIFGVLGGILSGIVIYSVWPYTYLENSKIWLAFGCILFIVLSYKRFILSNYAYGLLTAILPYFSLLKGLNISIPTLKKELALFFVILAFVNILPLVVLLCKPIGAVKFSKALKRSDVKPWKYPFILDFILFVIVFMLHLFKR